MNKDIACSVRNYSTSKYEVLCILPISVCKFECVSVPFSSLCNFLHKDYKLTNTFKLIHRKAKYTQNFTFRCSRVSYTTCIVLTWLDLIFWYAYKHQKNKDLKQHQTFKTDVYIVSRCTGSQHFCRGRPIGPTNPRNTSLTKQSRGWDRLC
jgi:hypothetical protein